MRLRHALPVVLLVVSGCGPLSPTRPDAAAAERAALARAFEARGELTQARFQWRVVAALSPGDAAPQDEIRRLDRLAQRRAQRLRETGVQDLSRGRTREGEQALRRAWALEPADAALRRRLRALDQQRLDRQLKAKAERSRIAMGLHGPAAGEPAADTDEAGERAYLANEMATHAAARAQAPAPAAAAPHPRAAGNEVRHLLQEADAGFRAGSDPQALAVLARARELAGANRRLKSLVQARRHRYANVLYARGLRTVAKDPGAAVALWHRALDYDPGHARAALRIKEAESRDRR